MCGWGWRSAGARLARWLQPEAAVRPEQCRLWVGGPATAGAPLAVALLLRDQDGAPVQCPGLAVELTAHLQDHKPGSRFYTVNPPPPLHLPYQVTVKENMRFQCITMMKVNAIALHTLALLCFSPITS